MLALRTIGSLVHPSPDLIGVAVNALDGVKNVNLEHLKLVVGIDSGGTALFLRQSTPGLAGFLLICSLRVAYDDMEIGEILYHIAVESGLSQSWPTSPQQLTQVAETLSGYAYRILLADHLYKVSSALLAQAQTDGRMDSYAMSKHMNIVSLSRILVSTFSCLLDEDVNKIILEGVASIFWIATILTWLMPDQTVVARGQNIIYGDAKAKLIIRLKDASEGQLIAEDSWTLKWQKDMPIESLVTFDPSIGSKESWSRYPRSSCKHMLQTAFNLKLLEIEVLDQIAGALLCFIVENGMLSSKMPNEEAKSIALLDTATDWYCQEYACIMRQYGWNADELVGQSKIYEVLAHWKIDSKDSVPELTRRLESWIKQNWNREDVYISEGILLEIMPIVKDSLLFMCWHNSHDSSVPNTMVKLHRHRGWSILSSFLQDPGVPLREFQLMVLEIIFPHHHELKGNVLMIASDGLVIWPSIIEKPSIERRMALALTFTPGYIKRKGERFSMVVEETEVVPLTFRGIESLGPANPFDQDRDSFTGLFPRSGLLQTELHVLTSTRGTILFVNTDMVFKGPNASWDEIAKSLRLGNNTGIFGREFSWLRVIEGISAAIHLDSRDIMTHTGEENLARRIWIESARPQNELPEWISADSSWHPASRGKYIARTCGDIMLCLYQLSQQNQFFVICHNASLIKAVSVANQHTNNWRIVT